VEGIGEVAEFAALSGIGVALVVGEALDDLDAGVSDDGSRGIREAMGPT